MALSHISETLDRLNLPLTEGEINAIISKLNKAIAFGKIKRSTAPDRERYPLRHIIALLTDKSPDNYNLTWINAVHSCPELDEFRCRASYSQNVTQQKTLKCGVTSLNLTGIVLLAAVFKYNHSAVINEASSALDQIAALRETLRDSSAETSEALDRVRDYLDSADDFDPDSRNYAEVEPGTIPTDRNYIVYLMRQSRSEVLKVGITDDLKNCIKQLRSDNPWLVPVAFFPVESVEAEAQLIRLLQQWKASELRGWFHDRPEVLAEITRFFLS